MNTIEQITDNPLLKFYYMARDKILVEGYGWELEICERRTFDQTRPIDFLNEYVFVLCNAGLRNQAAQKIFDAWKNEGAKAINHPSKRTAIIEMSKKDDFIEMFLIKLGASTDEYKIELLSQLSWIGNVTKYHLARNIGIDCAKPDRHLIRIAEKFGYTDVQDMCKFISNNVGERIGTVDVVLWRYSNLFGSKSGDKHD